MHQDSQKHIINILVAQEPCTLSEIETELRNQVPDEINPALEAVLGVADLYSRGLIQTYDDEAKTIDSISFEITVPF